jgi:endoglucanase
MAFLSIPARILAAVVFIAAPLVALSAMGGPAATVPPAIGAPVPSHRGGGTIGAADWALFKARFIRSDGELIDSYSQLSHSEGQGYALLLALGAGDQAAFDTIWTWTRINLKRSEDSLLAWKWKPAASGSGGAIGDSNDASDADILVAWALHRAARQWHDPRYDEAARPIARDVLAKLVREVSGLTVLMPGLSGFEHADGVTINLSYWIFPAFRSLNEIAPSPRWRELERSGIFLLGAARFGSAQLPSDWMVLKPSPAGSLRIAVMADKPLYGFDAMRIPLYLLWDRRASAATLAPFLALWHHAEGKPIPATVNLTTGAAANYGIPPGTRAIVTAAETRLLEPDPDPEIAGTLTPLLPPLASDADYYSAALGLLVRIALSDTN